jgi:NAD(P)-dependent dehydrogenase (short-subunit alcohol dehydrogenase family)
MAASINSSPAPSGRDLRGQTVVVIGGSSGVGLELAVSIAALAIHLMTNLNGSRRLRARDAARRPA